MISISWSYRAHRSIAKKAAADAISRYQYQPPAQRSRQMLVATLVGLHTGPFNSTVFVCTFNYYIENC